MADWGRCEFSELRRLAEQMEGLQAHVEEISTAMVKELAARMLDKVTRRTPVGKAPDGVREDISAEYWSGYVGGNLRRSWQVGNVVRRGDAFEIEVFNTAEYASYVEYGHRQTPGRYVPALGKRLKDGWVKGRFMLTISEEEMKAQAPAIIERRLTEYLGRM